MFVFGTLAGCADPAPVAAPVPEPAPAEGPRKARREKRGRDAEGGDREIQCAEGTLRCGPEGDVEVCRQGLWTLHYDCSENEPCQVHGTEPMCVG